MKNNPNHGNRLRPLAEAYEIKKKRSRDRYAESQLKNNCYWFHNKILRNLANLYGLNTEIPGQEFENLGFDFYQYKSITTIEGHKVHMYDKYGIYILSNKNICICKI